MNIVIKKEKQILTLHLDVERDNMVYYLLTNKIIK